MTAVVFNANAQVYTGRIEETTSKFMQDGHLYIRCGEVIYDAKGTKIRN